MNKKDEAVEYLRKYSDHITYGIRHLLTITDIKLDDVKEVLHSLVELEVTSIHTNKRTSSKDSCDITCNNIVETPALVQFLNEKGFQIIQGGGKGKLVGTISKTQKIGAINRAIKAAYMKQFDLTPPFKAIETYVDEFLKPVDQWTPKDTAVLDGLYQATQNEGFSLEMLPQELQERILNTGDRKKSSIENEAGGSPDFGKGTGGGRRNIRDPRGL